MVRFFEHKTLLEGGFPLEFAINCYVATVAGTRILPLLCAPFLILAYDTLGKMVYRLLADLILIVHLAFVAFVLLGGSLVLRWPRLSWIHLPCVAWGVLIEFIGFVCPLTPLEIWLRKLSGAGGYQGGFIEHYITATLYPSGLTRELQIMFGVVVLVLNIAVYGYILARRRD